MKMGYMPEPFVSRVIMESGDGTLAGSVHIELDTPWKREYIGEPETAILGTFVKVTRDFGNEVAMIEERCLNVPIPISLNGNTITEYSEKGGIRIVGFGYKNETIIHEKDLYGTLAFDSNNPMKTAEVRILTHGVWISTISFYDLPTGIFGIVNFDKLRKTANQCEIVQDKRLEELVRRLKPYADKIVAQPGEAVVM
jgi:hypothetical protein